MQKVVYIHFLCLKHQHIFSSKIHGRHKRTNTVDFVLAYQRLQKITNNRDINKVNDEIERQRFYRELRASGIMVNVDDDPTVSISILLMY